ncbi:MAG: hypothetical protein JW918_17320 [Anaerolineae bacterium]|nr:hypothetical protein [Anaerolineae bacterium]
MSASETDLEERLAQLKRQVPTRGLERHPLILKDVSELSAELQSPYVASSVNSDTIQTIIAFPPQIHRGWHYVPKQALLFTPTDVIHLQASIWPNQEPKATYLRGSGLMYMKITLLLLYGFLEIVAQSDTSPTQLGVEFNTVAWYQLSRPLRQLLQATKATSNAPTDKTAYTPVAKQAVENLPFKFSNGTKIYGVLPGEELEDLVFQPGIWKRWRLLFRRPVLANTLLLLTSNYVAVIQEDLTVKQGWIISYIPRSSISGMQSQLRGPWNELTVRLKRGDQTTDYKLTLTNEAVQVWRTRWIQCGGRWEDLPDEV